MSAVSATDADPGPPTKPDSRRSRVARHLGRIISLAVLVAVVLQLRRVDFGYVWSIVPTAPLFWVVFAANYFYISVADWIIFRRLWRIPVSGIVALLRKQIGNTLLFGYVGELYFYDWARKRGDLTDSPFGAVKDVAILSAIAGNLVTIAGILVAWPFFLAKNLGIRTDLIVYSLLFLVGSTVVILAFRRRVFSLARGQLWFIVSVHVARILTGLTLTGICWHLALPAVDLSWWVVLSVASMLLGRLPFVGNRDFAFAALAVFLIGHDADIPTLMTMMASAILATHLAFGVVLMLSDVLTPDRRREIPVLH